MNGCETLGNLWDHWNECGKNVPETHGVYKIILPAEMELRFVEGIEGHPVADTYDVETLTDKYKQSGYSKLLYVEGGGGCASVYGNTFYMDLVGAMTIVEDVLFSK